MATGDGIVWNEALPDNSTVANQIDDYDRDLRVGVRSRMAREHIWPSSQTATNEGGHHNFVTLQAQTSAPTMAGTTAGCLYVGASSAGYPLIFLNSTGTGITLVNSAGALPIITTGTQGSIPICSSANPNALVLLAASEPGMVLHTNTGTGAPTWSKVDLSNSAEVTGTGITSLRVFTVSGNWDTSAAITISHTLSTISVFKQILVKTAAGAWIEPNSFEEPDDDKPVTGVLILNANTNSFDIHFCGVYTATNYSKISSGTYNVTVMAVATA